MDGAEETNGLFPIHKTEAPRLPAMSLLMLFCKVGLLCGIIFWLVCASIARRVSAKLRGVTGVFPPLEIGAVLALMFFVVVF